MIKFITTKSDYTTSLDVFEVFFKGCVSADDVAGELLPTVERKLLQSPELILDHLCSILEWTRCGDRLSKTFFEALIGKLWGHVWKWADTSVGSQMYVCFRANSHTLW